MKKILFSLFAIFSLFLVNTNVFAESSLDNFTFTEDDYYELLDALKNYLGTSSINSYLNKQIVVYDSGIDIDYSDFNNGITRRNATVTLYMAKSSGHIIPHDDGRWITYNQQYLDCFYLEVGDGAEIVKNLDTGEISVDTFPGGGSHKGNPMLNYGNTWLIIYSNFDVILDNKTIFTPDNNFDISGSIEQGTGALSQPNKTIIERIWDTIKGIFNAIVSIPQKIAEFIRELFEDIVGGIALVDKDILNTFLNDLNDLLKNNFGFIYDVFDIIFDILNRFINISSGSHIINIPEIKEPISGGVIINSCSFNFDEVLNKYNIVFLHELYLSFVDVWVLIALINFGRKQYFRMFGGNL